MTTSILTKSYGSSQWNDISTHEAFFENFVASYLQKTAEPMLLLKQEHTRMVLEQAKIIIEAEKISDEEGRGALLAALYHDIGRFPQFLRWKTFSDAHSTNHGTLGVRTLKKEKFLENEPLGLQKKVLTAVGLHNRYILPPHLSPALLTITNVVRDADKIDIMRIMAKHMSEPVPSGDVVLHVINNPNQWSPSLVETILSGKVPNYTDLHFVNDFRMLLGSWIHDLHFATARAQIVASGYVEQVLSGLPQVEALQPIREYFTCSLAAIRRTTTKKTS